MDGLLRRRIQWDGAAIRERAEEAGNSQGIPTISDDEGPVFDDLTPTVPYIDPVIRRTSVMLKQVMRDYLSSTDWNKQPPPPPLPQAVIDQTADTYQEILRRLTA